MVKKQLATDDHRGALPSSGPGAPTDPQVPFKGRQQILVQLGYANTSRDQFHMCHLIVALLKRWWLGTYHDSMSPKHMPFYFEEFTFRFNRRKTNGVGRITSRLLQMAITSKPITEAELLGQPIAA